MNADRHTGFLLSRHWRDTAAGVELEFWFRTGSGPLCAVVSGQRALCFLPQNQADAAGRLLLGERGAQLQTLELRTFNDEPVVGLYCQSYRRLRQCVDRLEAAGLTPLEADINPAERFLMERFINSAAELQGEVIARPGHTLMRDPGIRSATVAPPLRVLSLDIETAMRGVQLYSIGVYGVDVDSEGKACGEPLRRVFMLGEGATEDFVVSLNSQRAVLNAFLEWLQDYDPDVIIGWAVVGFDIHYLQRVAEQEGVELAMGRDRRAATWRRLDEEGDRRTVQLHGRVVLDGIELLRTAFYRFESFSLQNVASELLGRGKLLEGPGRGEEIGELFRQDKDALARYNLVDCELVWEIFEDTRLLDFALERSRITGLAMDRLGGSVATFDHMYLPRLHRTGYVAPRVGERPEPSPGGFVLDSRPGIYDHVLVLDFKSLYPSIIRSFCIDPLGMARALQLPEDDPASVPGFAGARFLREGHILPSLIAGLWAERDRAKAEGNAALSNAIKIVMNSFYGVLGSPGCRFFDRRLATSITRRGHEILQRTRDCIEAEGQEVIYGDTDSVFVWVRDADSAEAAQAVGKQLEQGLNDWWRQTLRDEFQLDCVLELEFETHYRRFLMPTIRGSDKGSKKRYAGMVQRSGADELVFKGLENVRTDWTRLARDFQQELYRRVFNEEPYEEYVTSVSRGLLAGDYNDQLIYRKRLRRKLSDYQRNVPPHVQAARLYSERGLEAPSRGSWIEYVITRSGAEPADAALAPLDYQHYLDRQLQPVADGILCFLGTSFSALTDRQMAMF